MSDKNASDLDVFDGLVKKKNRESVPDDSGVQPSKPKAPPPPSIGRPARASAPPPPPSRAKIGGSTLVGVRAPTPPPRPSVEVSQAPSPPSSLAPRQAPPPPASAPAAPLPPASKAAAPPGPPSAPLPPQSGAPRSAPALPPPPSSGAVVSRPPMAPPARHVSSPALPPPSGGGPGLQAYSGGTSEDQTPTQLYMPGQTDRIEPRSAPMASPSIEIPSRPSRPSMPPSAYAHYPKVQSVPPPPAAPRSRIPVIAAVVGILLVAAYFVMRPTGGTLIVTVAGPGGRMVDGVEVFVDGDKKCAASPCKIEGIGAGAHLIRATAVGYQPTADQAVSVAAGEQNTHNVSLVKASATGIKVSSVGSGLRLYVDGKEVGPLPQTVTDLSAGQHMIKVGGNPRYKELEQSVNVEPDSVQEIGPLKLEVLKGLATFKAGPGADGAKVLVDGRLVPTLPTTVEVPAGKTPELEARKPGYATYRRTISFDDGVAEKTFEITMVEDSGGAGNYAPAPSPRPKPPGNRPAPPPRRPSRQPAAGQATLNMNSIPVSNVILNGRPLGPTPKVGISVAPGPVTVVFVHPELGRKVQSATVTAGSTRTFMARFR